jgi:hypothetical protein
MKAIPACSAAREESKVTGWPSRRTSLAQLAKRDRDHVARRRCRFHGQGVPPQLPLSGLSRRLLPEDLVLQP